MPTLNLWAFFVWALGRKIQFYHYSQTGFESKNVQSTGKINSHKHFLSLNALNECFRLTNLTIFSAIIQTVTRFYVIFSHFNVQFIKDINNLIFQIFTFNVLWDSLYSYIILPSILISAVYFNWLMKNSIPQSQFIWARHCSNLYVYVSKIKLWFTGIQVNHNTSFKRITLLFVYFGQAIFFWAIMLDITKSNIEKIPQTLLQ